MGGLLKKDALVKWGKTKGVTVMDLAEGELCLVIFAALRSC